MKNSDDIIRSMFARQVGESMLHAIQNESPEKLGFLAERNKKRGRTAENAHAKLIEGQRALIKEAFEILDVTDEDELNYESATTLVARIKEIYSKPGMDVNLPSEKGDRLLVQVARNYRLQEEDPDAALALAKFLLEKGADPNLEDQLSETALDYMDYNIEFDELTPQQSEITRLLREAGGLIRAFTDDGEKFGERGDTIGRHEEERFKLQQQQQQQQQQQKGGQES